MDTLTFNSPILLRHLTFSEAKKMPISCIELKTALEDLEMSMDQVCRSLPHHRCQRAARNTSNMCHERRSSLFCHCEYLISSL